MFPSCSRHCSHSNTCTGLLAMQTQSNNHSLTRLQISSMWITGIAVSISINAAVILSVLHAISHKWLELFIQTCHALCVHSNKGGSKEIALFIACRRHNHGSSNWKDHMARVKADQDSTFSNTTISCASRQKIRLQTETQVWKYRNEKLRMDRFPLERMDRFSNRGKFLFISVGCYLADKAWLAINR